MKYISKKPTETKKRFFNFMEKNKKQGVVSSRKLKEYMVKQCLKPKYIFKDKIRNTTNYFLEVKKGHKKIADISIVNKKSPRINYWRVY